MKFKNNKNKKVYKKAKQLPSNSRIIPEISGDSIVFVIGLFCIIGAILVLSLSVYSGYREKERLSAEKTRLTREADFWQKQINMRPNYRDAYFSLALIQYRLKDLNLSKENLDKALTLDPNFSEGRDLQKLLESNF